MSRLSIVRIHCQYKCQKGGNFPKLSIIVGVVTGVSDVSDVFVFVFVFVCHCHCQVTKIFRNSVSQFPELLWVSQMPQVSEIVFVFVFVRKVKSLSKCIFQIVFVKLYLSKCIFSCLSISLVRCLKDQKILHSKVRKLATKIASRQNSVNFDKNYLAAKWRKLWEKWHTVCNITTLCVELYNTLCVKKLHSWLHRFVCDVWISDYKQTFSFQSQSNQTNIK